MLLIGLNTLEGIEITVAPSQEPTTFRVVLVEVQSRQYARLGFEAPQSVRIVREELLKKTAK